MTASHLSQQHQTNKPPMAKSATKRYLGVKVRLQEQDASAMQWALFTLTDSLGHLTSAEEIFFRVPQGQLKLRLAHPGKDIGELISSCQYPAAETSLQTNSRGRHFFEARTSSVSQASQLRHTLNLNLEELAVIRKKRRTFTLGPVKFHLDTVEGILDSFLDIEIHPQNELMDEKLLLDKSDELLKQLEIPGRALIPHSYLELFLHSQQKREESDESAFSDESVP